MKTQINTLVNGSSHVINFNPSIKGGSNTKTRNLIADKVKEENPEVMAIKVKGIELIGKAQWSISRKSVSWNFKLTVEEYIKIAETSFGVSPRSERNNPYLTINGDCTIRIGCGNQWAFVPESWVEILY